MAALASHIIAEGADPISLFDPPQYRQGMDRQAFEQKKREIRALRVNWAKFFNPKGPEKDHLASKGLISLILSRLEARLETAASDSRKGHVLVYQLRNLANEIKEGSGGDAPKRQGSAQFLTGPQKRAQLERALGDIPEFRTGLEQENYQQVVDNVDHFKRNARITLWSSLEEAAGDLTKTPQATLDLRSFAVCKGLYQRP